MNPREKYVCENCGREVSADEAWVLWTEHQVDYWEGRAHVIEPLMKVIHSNDSCWEKSSRDYPLRLPMNEFLHEFPGIRMQINAAAWDGLVLRQSVMDSLQKLYKDSYGEEFFNLTYNDYYRYLSGSD